MRKIRMGLTNLRIAILLLLLPFCFLHAQSADSLKTINPKRIRPLIVGSVITYTGAMVVLNQAWYSQYKRQSFHFFNDASEWNQMDKLGHFFSAYHITSIYSRVLQWGSLKEDQADRAAALTSWGVMASIEVLDGFSSGYGASASDLAANTLGAGLYIGQKMIWHEIRIHPKYSFHKTSLAPLRPALLGSNLGEQILKDYNGQTQWLSVDIDKFISFPSWLNVAVGYGTQDMVYADNAENRANGFHPYRQFYLALDFDTNSIRTKSKLVKSLLRVAGMIKIPAPTLEFSGGKVKMHSFYF